MKNLPDKIVIAIAGYYIDRMKGEERVSSRVMTQEYDEVTYRKSRKKWEKGESLDRLNVAIKGTGWGYSASCGTFWLTRGKVAVEITEDTWPEGKRTILKPKNAVTK